MKRTLDAAVVAELSATVVRPILLVDLTFSDNTYHFWTGVGQITYNGATYVGTGALGKIEGLNESNQVEASGVSITLEGIDSTYITESRGEISKSGPATIGLAFLDPLGNIVGTPLTCFSGYIDNAELEFGASTGSVKLNIETRMTQINRSRGGRYTDADQIMRCERNGWSIDTGLRYCSYNVDKRVVWK